MPDVAEYVERIVDATNTNFPGRHRVVAILTEAKEKWFEAGFDQGSKEYEPAQVEAIRLAENERCCKVICVGCAEGIPLNVHRHSHVHSDYDWRPCTARAMRQEVSDA